MSHSIPTRLLVPDSGGQLSKFSWRQFSAWALAAFFVAGSLELTTAVLLARAPTRLCGAVLGCTVMCAALRLGMTAATPREPVCPTSFIPTAAHQDDLQIASGHSTAILNSGDNACS